jgi:ribose 5-phosphate isomerase B
MKLVVGADHAGFPAKQLIIDALRERGHEVLDVGTYSDAPVDFPDIARALAEVVLDGQAERGILVCGTGIGASIATNKIRGIRAALAHDIYSAHQSVEHDNANVLCLGAQVVGPKVIVDLLDAFVRAQWLPDEEFHRRVAKLEQLEAAMVSSSEVRAATSGSDEV